MEQICKLLIDTQKIYKDFKVILFQFVSERGRNYEKFIKKKDSLELPFICKKSMEKSTQLQTVVNSNEKKKRINRGQNQGSKMWNQEPWRATVTKWNCFNQETGDV